MSGKLDIALDDIVKEKRNNSRRTRRVARSAKPTTTAAGPATGIKKNKSTKVTTTKATPAPSVPAATGPSKIIVSNLPMDVTEAQIKEYFMQTIGPVKKVFLTYGPNGQSRGVSTIIFSNATAANEAAQLLNGTKVDGRPMKVEVVLGANQAPASAPAKALSDRIQATTKSTKNPPKTTAPKPATAAKDTKNSKSKKKTPRGRNAGRPKKKTAEELDTEMNDYFAAGTTGDANAGGAVQPVANGGDAAMEEVL